MLPDMKFKILGDYMAGPAFTKMRKDLAGVDGVLASTSERMGRMGRNMRNFGAGMSIGVTAPLVLAMRQSIGLYDIQAKAEAKVRQGIESTGSAAGFSAKELFNMASAMQDLTLFGDEKILSDVTGQLLTFTNVAGDAFERAQMTAMDMSTVLETDVKASALMLGKALNDPIKGLTALSRAGVQFSKEQTDVIKSLAETGEVAAAQSMILDELEKQFGGQAAAAAAAGTGQITQLSNSWGDFKEQLGAVAMDFLPPVVSGLKSMVSGLNSLSPATKKFVVIGAGVAALAGPVLMGLGMMTMGFAALAPVVGVAAGVLGLILSPIGLVVAAVVAAGAAVWHFRDDIAAGFQNGLDGIQAPTEGMVGVVGDMVGGIAALLQGDFAGAWEFAKSAAGGFFMVLGEAIGLALKTLSDFGSWALAVMTGDWAGAIDAGKAILSDFVGFVELVFGTQIIEAVTKMVGGVKDVIVNGLGGVIDWAGEKLDWLGDKFYGLYDAVVGHSYIPDMAEGVIEWFGIMFNTIGPQTETMTGDIADKFAEMGSTVVSESQDVAAATTKIFDEMGSTITSGLMDFVQSGSYTLNNFRHTVAGIWGDISGSALSSAMAPVTSGLGNWISGGLESVFGGMFANGAAFQGGNVVPFATGGVVSGATNFPMSGGRMGVMGEAGPEAIMPLTRGAGGRLGVAGSTPHVSFDVSVQSRDPDATVSIAPSRRQTGRQARAFAGV